MWALCPPSYHDNDMPIDLRKKVVLQREIDERRDNGYHDSEDAFAPKDYSIKEGREKWEQANLLPVRNLHPFMSERYGVRCSVVETDDREKPQDLRPTIRGTLETTIKKLHNSKLKQALSNGREERCK